MEVFSHTIQLLDIILGLILAWGAYKGYRRGLIMELLSIATLIVTLMVIFIVFTKGLTGIENLIGFEFPPSMSFFTFFLLYIVIIFVVNKLGRYFQKKINYSILNDFDNIAGAAVSLFKFAIFLSILLNLGSFVGIEPGAAAIEETFLYSNLIALQDTSIEIISKVMPSFETTYAELKSLFNVN